MMGDRRGLAFEVVGEGRPLVFLHGLGASRAQTTAALAGLEGVRLVAPDLPGHGEAGGEARAVGRDAVGFTVFRALVRRLLAEVGEERVVLGGLSMGAGIAAGVALEEAERVAGVVLVRPSWLDAVRPAHLEIVARVGRWLEERGVEGARAALHGDPEWRRMRTEVPGAAASVEGVIDRGHAVEFAAVLDAMVADRPFEDLGVLAGMEAPALVLSCPSDPLHPEEVARRMAEALPHAEVVRLAPRYVEPERHRDELRRKVGRFVRRCLG